ncbi:amino acid adenylation domain-containing protein [Streptomyces paludis]|uniref:amino acid adenylation domain-containing protein n=1 Tax=Streptomyces paludis TaxID=2282738 RepID=UPI0013B38EE1|nr:amino acid adenylation domain-containing protein [Streptomyces paludis]
MHDPAVPQLIHEAVSRQARLRPTAVAVVHQGERIDYATLDAAADTYAEALDAAGVRPGTTVPVLLPRSARLVAVLLAVLKRGAAYAALDRRWPQERIHRIASVLRAPVMVTGDKPDAGEMPDAGGPPGAEAWSRTPRWTVPDESPRQAASRRGVPQSVTVDSAGPATVFFTSGSTGVPKGVLSPHRATTRLFSNPGFADFGPGRVVIQAAPASWDAFSMEVWGPLTTGGTCVIADTDYLLPDTLGELVTSAGVDTAWLTASLFNLLVDEDDPEHPCFTGLRQVLTGGERLSPAHVGRFLDRYPDIALTNGYGPVESCVFATTHRITAADRARPDGIPVGVPVPGTTVHILDGEQALPPGTVGEICLAGEGLALGYVGDAEATASAFPSLSLFPLAAAPVRVYRTGDLGLLDAEGTLHFRGRADRQIKISGHRVEPGEIESAARGIAGIREAAVVPVPAAGGGYDRLALFYTAKDPDAPSPTAVRRALAARLPGHLVPHRVLQRVVLPTTTTGKLDRAALLDAL